jgi:hypothetical protein
MDFNEFFSRIAMSLDKARETLGVPPNATQDEIDKAYKALAFKLHPDREGGNEEAFKELGIAKATLEGKARPTYDRRPEAPPAEPPSSYRSPPREPAKKKEVSFDEAKSKAGIPGGVEWLFITPSQRGTSYSSDEFQRGDSTFIVYGRTASQHVFVAARHTTYAEYFIGGGAGEDVWTMKSFEYPIKADEGQNPAWLYGNVVKALKAVGFKGKFNSKVIDAKDWKFGEGHFPHGAEVSIKHWLVNSGQVAGDAPSVANRKQVVELQVDSTMIGPKPGYYANPKAVYSSDYYKLTLIINGRPFDLGEADTLKFFTDFKGGLRWIFGEYAHQGGKKNLTRMPKGKPILSWMAENFKGLPADALASLQAAAAQMKG